MNILGLDVERLEKTSVIPVLNPERRRWSYFVSLLIALVVFPTWLVTYIIFTSNEPPETLFFAALWALTLVFTFGEIGQGICLGMYGRRVASWSVVGWWMRGLVSVAYFVVMLFWCMSAGGLTGWLIGNWYTGAAIGGAAGATLSAYLLYLCVREYRSRGFRDERQGRDE